MLTETLNELMNVIFMIVNGNVDEKVRVNIDGNYVFIQKCGDTELFVTYEGNTTNSFKVDFRNFSLANYVDFRQFVFTLICRLTAVIHHDKQNHGCIIR